MGFLGSLGSGMKTLGAAAIVFAAGLLTWPFVSGVLAGVLDSVGIVIPATTYLAAAPVVAGIAAAYTAAEVGS